MSRKSSNNGMDVGETMQRHIKGVERNKLVTSKFILYMFI
jgi:hypothetical protein